MPHTYGEQKVGREFMKVLVLH